MTYPRNVDKLGISPAVEDVLEWFRSSGFTEEIVGKSIQKRNLILFHRTIQSKRSIRTKIDDDEQNIKRIKKRKTILFMSLVHGNEPLGLINLLYTAEALFLQQRQDLFSLALKEDEELLLLFFPIVNVDAYTLNQEFFQKIEMGGCRRTNLNHTCSSSIETINATIACPELMSDGVDLNRNFPFDWGDSSDEVNDHCTYNYAGYQPFSEPETRAIRDVVENNNPIDASISYHSLGRSPQGLLIHPYASGVYHEYKSEESRLQIQKFGAIMNKQKYYVVGNAENAIHYTAGGTALDWLYTTGNVSTPFVHESGTPCGRRWCGPRFEWVVKNNARIHAEVGVTLVKLVLGGILAINAEADVTFVKLALGIRLPRIHFHSIFLMSLVFIVSLSMAFCRHNQIATLLRHFLNLPWRAKRRQSFDQPRDVELKII